MAAGPVGSVWATGSWEDTAWEADSWADAVLYIIIRTLMILGVGK